MEEIISPERQQPGRKTARQTDPRSIRSQVSLRDALLRLVEDREFDKITLREITNEAGVSYPTFFNHYDSKDALFLDIARGQINDLLAAFQHGRHLPSWRPGWSMCVFILERRNLWRTLLTAGASDEMRAQFIRRGRELATGERMPDHGFPLDVVSGVMASGTFEIMAWWLSQDADCPVANIADMLESMVIEPALGVPAGFFINRERQ